jgi:hypothetical protein
MGGCSNMNLDGYSALLGKCWAKYNSLETIIRVYLMKYYNQPENGIDEVEGETCQETYLTNYMTFGQLLVEYNKVAPKGFEMDYGDSILRFRDSMAHGRVVTLNVVPITVHKYSRPNAGNVVLEIKQVLSEEYLTEMGQKLFFAVEMVHKAVSLLK